MNEPKKQHYVPQVYLKRFSFDNVGNLYTLKHKSSFPSKVKKYNKSAICFEENRFRFNNDEIIKNLNITDLNVIEKTVFKYEESELESLFDKIDHRKKITSSEYNKLLQILLDIKSRNPFFSNQYLSQPTESKYIDDQTKQLKDEAIAFCKAYGIDEEIVYRAAKRAKEVFDDENYRFNSYLNSLLNHNQIREEVISMISNWNPVVFYTDYENPFITSDNPGFTFNKNDKLYNTHFSIIDAFVFPISPKSLLCLRKVIRRKDLNIFKEIKYQKVQLINVLNFNKATALSANELIISNLKDPLLITKKSLSYHT